MLFRSPQTPNPKPQARLLLLSDFKFWVRLVLGLVPLAIELNPIHVRLPHRKALAPPPQTIILVRAVRREHQNHVHDYHTEYQAGVLDEARQGVSDFVLLLHRV